MLQGHGIRNTTVQVDKHKFIRNLTAEGYETLMLPKKTQCHMVTVWLGHLENFI